MSAEATNLMQGFRHSHHSHHSPASPHKRPPQLTPNYYSVHLTRAQPSAFIKPASTSPSLVPGSHAYPVLQTLVLCSNPIGQPPDHSNPPHAHNRRRRRRHHLHPFTSPPSPTQPRPNHHHQIMNLPSTQQPPTTATILTANISPAAARTLCPSWPTIRAGFSGRSSWS